MDLTEIANTPGFGSGKRARDRLYDEATCRETIPPRENVAPVYARPGDIDHLVPLALFGNSGEDGQDWSVYHGGIDDLREPAFGIDAKSDAEMVAAIINAYRLGILVLKNDDPHGVKGDR